MIQHEESNGLTQREGDREVTREVEYNLDVIVSVGFCAKTHRGTQFRVWATQRLREYIIKGFALDDERLKRAGALGCASTVPGERLFGRAGRAFVESTREHARPRWNSGPRRSQRREVDRCRVRCSDAGYHVSHVTCNHRRIDRFASVLRRALRRR